jgi:hypothetical protein
VNERQAKLLVPKKFATSRPLKVPPSIRSSSWTKAGKAYRGDKTPDGYTRCIQIEIDGQTYILNCRMLDALLHYRYDEVYVYKENDKVFQSGLDIAQKQEELNG